MIFYSANSTPNTDYSKPVLLCVCVCVSFLWYPSLRGIHKKVEGGGEKLLSLLLSPISPPFPLLSPPLLTPTLQATSFGGGAGSRSSSA